MRREKIACVGTYVAFLRAINLGPVRKFPKADIVAATEAAGFTGVATHINTGNVLLETTMRSRARIERALERAYAERAGFEVPTIVFSARELAAIAADGAELDAARPGIERHYVYLLKDEPTAEQAAALTGSTAVGGEVVLRGRAAHVLLGPDYRPGNVDPYRLEKRLGIVATNRNLNVVTTIARKWCR